MSRRFKVGDIVDWHDYNKTNTCAGGSTEFLKLGRGPFEITKVEQLNGIYMIDIRNIYNEAVGKGWGEPHFTLKVRKMQSAFDEIKNVIGR